MQVLPINRSKLFTAFCTMAILTVAAGCHSKKQATSASQETVATPAAPVATGSVVGVIHAVGHFSDPVEIDMAQDPACALGDSGKNMTEQYVIHEGGLANVYLYIKDGLGHQKFPVPTVPVTLDQKGCRYVPHVIAVMAGQTILVKNSDMTMHNVHGMPTGLNNHISDMTEMPGSKPMEMSYADPEEMIPVRCNNHPWMEAFVNVSSNPFYAISDSTGHFAIHGLPAGTYTLAAVHEKIGEKDMTITVPADGTATADFSFSQH